MGEVEFIGEEQRPQYEPNYSVARSSSSGGWLVRLVVKSGLAKGEQGAERVLLIFFCVCLIITFFILFRGGGSSFSSTPPSIPLGEPITHKL
ncbi:MAG: hypothetical protein NT098_03805 [Candidatus Parcubacteria bacterium]|nr:hypothetical protein [Candidatus Parcubacteria bacterium]